MEFVVIVLAVLGGFFLLLIGVSITDFLVNESKKKKPEKVKQKAQPRSLEEILSDRRKEKSIDNQRDSNDWNTEFYGLQAGNPYKTIDRKWMWIRREPSFQCFGDVHPPVGTKLKVLGWKHAHQFHGRGKQTVWYKVQIPGKRETGWISCVEFNESQETALAASSLYPDLNDYETTEIRSFDGQVVELVRTRLRGEY